MHSYTKENSSQLIGLAFQAEWLVERYTNDSYYLKLKKKKKTDVKLIHPEVISPGASPNLIFTWKNEGFFL